MSSIEQSVGLNPTEPLKARFGELEQEVTTGKSEPIDLAIGEATVGADQAVSEAEQFGREAVEAVRADRDSSAAELKAAVKIAEPPRQPLLGRLFHRAPKPAENNPAAVEADLLALKHRSAA